MLGTASTGTKSNFKKGNNNFLKSPLLKSQKLLLLHFCIHARGIKWFIAEISYNKFTTLLK